MTDLAFFVPFCDSCPLLLSFVAFVKVIAGAIFLAFISVRIDRLDLLRLLVG